MVVIRQFLVVTFVVISIYSVNHDAHALQSLDVAPDSTAFMQPIPNSYLNLMVGLRKYLNSFTSWQFPNKGGPQDPYSRLEFPWDQTFLAIRGSASYPGLEVNLEWSGTLSVFSSVKAQDSDWTFPNLPNQKTLFDEAEANPRCWIVDLSCNSEVPFFSPLRVVFGYRVSQFKFTYGDGYFHSIDPAYNSGPEYGPRIEFVQYYQHLYAGGIVETYLNTGELISPLQIPPVNLRIQTDAAYVIGKNCDDHVVRPDILMSYLRSYGFGWHINLSAGIRTGRLRFEVEGDVRGISACGTFESIEERNGTIITEYVDGAKAWSEQKYLGVSGTLFF